MPESADWCGVVGFGNLILFPFFKTKESQKKNPENSQSQGGTTVSFVPLSTFLGGAMNESFPERNVGP